MMSRPILRLDAAFFGIRQLSRGLRVCSLSPGIVAGRAILSTALPAPFLRPACFTCKSMGLRPVLAVSLRFASVTRPAFPPGP